MKRVVIGVLIIGSVVAAIALIFRKRSRSGADDWDTLAEDSFARASTAVSNVSDTVKDEAPKVADTAKDAAAKVSDTSKDGASKASEATKDAVSKATDAAKDAGSKVSDAAKDA